MMNAAQYVVSKFGGQSALARLVGKGRSTVQHWCRAGVIPAKWHAVLLEIARDEGIALSADDLIAVPPELLGEGEAPARLPEARWSGELTIGENSVPVYVLDDGRRVISRTGATSALIGPQGGGKIESYIAARAVAEYVPRDLHLMDFSIPGVSNKNVQGMDAETFLDICRGYVRARDEGTLTTPTQQKVAIRASMFISAVAKVGLIALIDEVTGYQYDRAQDALQLKLRLFLAEEMRAWEKTFPDQLWEEFGRLTGWRGQPHQRPKYWGHLVMELIYGYLDRDVAEWLKKNKPKPRHGQNYHQWLNEQYGLKKLTEHLWLVVGMASACQSMDELKRKMAEKYGRQPVQYTLYLPYPTPRALTRPLAATEPRRAGDRTSPEPRQLPLGSAAEIAAEGSESTK